VLFHSLKDGHERLAIQPVMRWAALSFVSPLKVDCFYRLFVEFDHKDERAARDNCSRE
jgi:hypothetical protein